MIKFGMRSVALAFLGVATLVSGVRADEVALALALDNSDDAVEVLLTLVGNPEEYRFTPEGGDELDGAVEITEAAATDGSLLVRWSGGTVARSELTLTLTMAAAGRPVKAYLLDRTLTAPPKPLAVTKSCLGGSPSGLRDAFEMLYTCREMALALEVAGKRWKIPHRAAMQGWLVANLYLFEKFGWGVDAGGVPVGLSPYGADPQLLERLQEVVDDGEDVEKLKPLSIGEAKRFFALIADRPLRLAGDIPRLMELRRYDLAKSINDEALVAFRSRPNQQGAIRGLTLSVLQRQGCDIDARLGGRVSAPECTEGRRAASQSQ